jgi:lipopolysaccharide exporter
MDRRQYLRHFMIILSGNSAAQAVNLLSYPLLGRLYTPHEFGIFAMFVAAVAVPAVIACGRFDLAITTAPKAGRYGVLWLSVIIAIWVGCLSIAGGAFYWRLIGQGSGLLVPFLIGLAVTLTGVCSAQSMFLMRHDRYRAQSLSVLFRTGGAVLSQIALGLVAATSLSLILGFVFGLLAQAVVQGIVIWLRLNPKRPKLRDMRAMFRRFRRQVSVDVPSSLVSGLSINLLTFLLAGLYNTRTVGFYSIGNRLAVVPLLLFNDALSQTFFQKAELARELKGHFWDEMKFSIWTSGLLSIAVVAGIALLAHPFITIYLGKQWAPAADMLIILAPMLAVRGLTMSIATTVFVMRSAHWLFIHNIANVLTTVMAYAIAVVLGLSVVKFLVVASAMLTIEYALFATFLIVKAHSARRQALA